MEEIKDRIWNFVEEHESRGLHKEPSFSLDTMVDCNYLIIAITLQHKGNWMDFNKKSIRRSKFMLALKQICLDLNVEFSTLPQVIIEKRSPKI